MPVPSSISDLSTTPALNSPPGSESPSMVDDYLRTHAAFIKQINDLAATKADDSALASKADDSAVVKLTGAQTVAGTKTFSESPTAPTPTTSDSSTKVATTALVAAKIAADNATTIKDVKASRSVGVTYYNTSPHNRTVCVICNWEGGAGYMNLHVDGKVHASNVMTGGFQTGPLTVTVPPGAGYVVTFINMTGSINAWTEVD